MKVLNFRNGVVSKTLRYISRADCASLSLDELDSCFFLVDTECEEVDFRKIAEAVFASGCREYSFAGAASFRWECNFDMFDCERDVPEDDWATTSQYENLREFAEMLDIAISSSQCLLVYDNPVTLLELQHLLLDMWEEGVS